MNSIVFNTLGIAIMAATLPLSLELVVVTAAFLLPHRAIRSRSRRSKLRLVALIPAHNEEMLIEGTIESLRRADHQIPILVVAHNCTDRTARKAEEGGARALVLDEPEKHGKGFALKHGFDVALAEGADAVLVIDADAEVSANLVECVRQRLAEGADAVQCRYEFSAAGSGARAELSALAARAFNLIRPAGRSRLGLSAGILGSGFALHKDVLLQVPYQAVSLVEDLEYHLQLVRAGKRVEFLRQASVLSQLPTSERGAASQRTRWEAGRFQAARKWLLPLTAQALGGQWRLVEPVLDLAALPLALSAALLLFTLLIAEGWIAIYAAAALAVMAIHVLTATLAGEHPGREVRLLTMAPIYVLWKLCLLPRMIRGSRSGADWIRTERNPGALRPANDCVQRGWDRSRGKAPDAPQRRQPAMPADEKEPMTTEPRVGTATISAGGEGTL